MDIQKILDTRCSLSQFFFRYSKDIRQSLGRRRTQSFKKTESPSNEMIQNFTAKITGINIFAHTEHTGKVLKF